MLRAIISRSTDRPQRLPSTLSLVGQEHGRTIPLTDIDPHDKLPDRVDKCVPSADFRHCRLVLQPMILNDRI